MEQGYCAMTQVLLWWCLGSALLVVVCLACPLKWLRGNLLLTLLTLACAAWALATGALAIALRTYAVFTHEAPVATVSCSPLPGMPPHFALRYTPVHPADTQEAAQTFDVVGDQWMVSGDILKWHPWLTLLGFRTVHKPTRLSGRFTNLALERAVQPTAFDLNGGTGPLWTWLHHAARWLPFVEAVYGNGVFTYADPHRTCTIYVTPSGYIVK